MTITGKYVEKKNPQELLVGLKFVVATVQNDMEIPQEIEKRTAMWSRNLTSGYLPEEKKKKKTNLKKYAHFNFFSEFFTIVRIRK